MSRRDRQGTGIQWTHWPGEDEDGDRRWKGETWNPSTGCDRVSAGCDHCYAFVYHDNRHLKNRDEARAWLKAHTEITVVPPKAEVVRHARQLGAELTFPKQYDYPFSTVQILDDFRLNQPLRWEAPRAIFVGSMADLFHEDVPFEFLDQVFAMMALTTRHQYMLLTKRPERAREYLRQLAAGTRKVSTALYREGMTDQEKRVQTAKIFLAFDPTSPMARPFMLPNVGLMTTVENEAQAEIRVPILLDTPVRWRGLSVEPQLEWIWLESIMTPHPEHPDYGGTLNALAGTWWPLGAEDETEEYETPAIDWVICGGESGEHARPFDLTWARSLMKQCADADVPFFMKQLGQNAVEGPHPYPVKYHGGDPDEMPEDLRVREFPWPAHFVEGEVGILGQLPVASQNGAIER